MPTTSRTIHRFWDNIYSIDWFKTSVQFWYSSMALVWWVDSKTCKWTIMVFRMLICCWNCFCMACQPIRGKISKSLCLTCRNMSSAIYFLHTVFIYGIIDSVFGVDSPIIMKFSISVLLSIVVLFVVKKMKIHPVKWLLCVK